MGQINILTNFFIGEIILGVVYFSEGSRHWGHINTKDTFFQSLFHKLTIIGNTRECLLLGDGNSQTGS